MKKQILIVTAAALTAAVVILNGTSAATAQQTPQYQVGGFPITSLQMSVLQPSDENDGPASDPHHRRRHQFFFWVTPQGVSALLPEKSVFL
jgi:hypothetical protein